MMTMTNNNLRALALLAVTTLAASLLVLVAGTKPAQAAFPGLNGKIAFTSNRDGDQEVYVINKDGSGTPTNLTNDPASDIFPAVSPDGTKIAFESTRDGNSEVYLMNSNGSGTPVNLTNNGSAVDSDPNFSPEGTKIVCTTNRHGGPDIYVMKAADGSGQTRLTNTPGIDQEPAFSPDGTKIAFTSKRDGNKEVYSMSAEDADNDGNGDNPTNLTNSGSATDEFPDWGNVPLGDDVPPTVSGVAPSSGQAGVARDTSPTATFSEEMNPNTLSTSTVKLSQEQWVRIKKGKKKRWVVRQVSVSVQVSCDNPC